MKKELRPYQENAIQSICDGFSKNSNQLCVLPTGAGKTVIFCNVIKKLQTKTLILAHTQELIEQIKKTISTEIPDHSVCKYSKRGYRNSDIVICTIQSAIRSGTIESLKKDNFDLLIIDECHRSCAKGYRRVIQELGFDKKKMLGVTATPFRTDKQSVHEIFGFCSFSMSILKMIEEDYLVDLEGYKVKTNVSIKNIRKAGGDFVSSKLEPVINTKNRNSLIVNEYLKLSPGEKSVAFCCSVKHALDLCKEFTDRNITCDVIHGKTEFSKRKRILEDFKTGKTQVLTNCNLLTEGFDEPSITSLLMCRPTISKTLYIQMIGRGLRKFENKKTCKVIEFTDNEFDVCELEDLLNSEQRKIPIKNGESFCDYAKRAEKELLEGSTDTVIQRHEIILKESYTNRKASPWQREELKKRNIDFIDPLLEITANYLLTRGL